METIRTFLRTIPATVWVIVAVIALVGFWWLSDDVGAWWEKRKQGQFDKAQDVHEQQVADLKAQYEAAVKRAQEAEAREQVKQLEADLIRQEAAKHGVNVAEAQKVIDAATSNYEKDQQFMNDVAAGKISKLALCEKSCTDSAKEGYPCRPNYCDSFK